MKVTFLSCLMTLWVGMLCAEPARWVSEWPETDFSKTTVKDWREILSGGPPKDGIPALTNPRFIPISEADLPENEPLIVLEMAGERPRGYPLRYLMWHEIVNDRIGNMAVAITFCPLCNSALSFDRSVGDQVLEFGVTGKLRHSDMVIYDRQTQSWWQQAQGLGLVGAMAGVQLTFVPSWVESIALFKSRNPNGLIIQEPDYARQYGRNPYVGYDGSQRPFLFNGDLPPHNIPALSRVVRVGERAWPLERLRKVKELREAGVVLTWQAGQASALDDGFLAKGKDVGNIHVQTLEGQNLPHDIMFAFAFHAFWPGGQWMLGH